MDILSKEQAMEKAFENLIDTYKKMIEENVKKINEQIMRESYIKVQKDLKENGCNLEFSFKEAHYIPELKSEIDKYELILKNLEESKGRLLNK